jgi:hypothetical protein
MARTGTKSIFDIPVEAAEEAHIDVGTRADFAARDAIPRAN